MGERTANVTQIALEQRQAEEQILAHSALLGERAVAWARLAFIALVGAATQLGAIISGERTGSPSEAPLRGVVVGLYLGFTLGTLWATYRDREGRPRRAFYAPFAFTAVDYGFLLANVWIDTHLVGLAPVPHVAAASAALFVCFSLARYSVWHIAASVVGAIVTVTLTAHVQGWLSVPWGAFVAACFVALGVLIAFTNQRIKKMFIDVRRHENLSRFLPRQVVDRVLKSAGAALEPVEREVTILFSDIRDFTSLSERKPPEQVLRFLDDYFGHMAQIVKGHEGMLNKFLGDGLMAVWGVPEPQPDHAERALKAAIDMKKKLAELNAERQRAGLLPIRIGIGVHSGVVAAGMLGGADQREYTVIGDAVNLASRIEGLTKSVGADILASERAFQLGGGRLHGERVGEEKVKGRASGVVVYAVREGPEARPTVTG